MHVAAKFIRLYRKCKRARKILNQLYRPEDTDCLFAKVTPRAVWTGLN